MSMAHWGVAALYLMAGTACSSAPTQPMGSEAPDPRPIFDYVEELGEQEPPEDAPPGDKIDVQVYVVANVGFAGGVAWGEARVTYVAMDARATVILSTPVGTVEATRDAQHMTTQGGATITARAERFLGGACDGSIKAEAFGEAWQHFLILRWGHKRARAEKTASCFPETGGSGSGAGGGGGGGGGYVYYIECTGNLVYELGADGRWHYVGVEGYSCSSTPIWVNWGEWET
ncbi:MAG: hypothetical protein ACRENB_05645 [Gemmatimonadales bacterium]